MLDLSLCSLSNFTFYACVFSLFFIIASLQLYMIALSYINGGGIKDGISMYYSVFSPLNYSKIEKKYEKQIINYCQKEFFLYI